MAIYKKFSEVRVYRGKTHISYEYDFDNKDINYALVKIKGRYPTEGYLINKISTECNQILKGKAIVWVDGKIYHVKKNDVIIITPSEKYYWKGNVLVNAPCSPPWTLEQSANVKE